MYIDTDQDSVINNPVTVSDEYGDAIRFNPRVNFLTTQQFLLPGMVMVLFHNNPPFMEDLVMLH